MDPITIGLITSLIGAGGQALTSLFGGKEKPGEYGQQSTLTPEQQQVFSSLIGGLSGGDAANVIRNQLAGNVPGEQESIRQFKETFIPDLAEQFAGAGALRSSGFEQQASQGAERLASMLSAQRGQYQQQGLQNLQNMLGMRTTYPTYTPSTPSIGQRLAPAFGQLAGMGGNLMTQGYGNQNLVDLLALMNKPAAATP